MVVRRGLAVVTALAAVLGGGLVSAPAAPAAPAAATAEPTPLPPELEEIRAAEATALYGDPAIRPMAERRTSLISLGDSQISGEGVGTYEEGTDGPDNWCHRSPDSAIHRTGIAADVTYNVACSGANTEQIRIGGTPQYDDELLQSDNLAIKARNTKLKMITLVIGANDDLEFGPVMTDCVVRWILSRGACNGGYQDGWQERVDGLRGKVERAITDLRTVMGDAGYLSDDYKLVVMGYPSPVGPDYRDNPDHRTKLLDGCTLYDADMEWGRDTAVPVFERGIRQAARDAGAAYLDNSRLFQGHEVCSDSTWVRGLWLDLSNPVPPDSNSARQSFHPNARGHAAFASCFTQFYASGLDEASCADPGSTDTPKLYPLAWDDVFQPLTDQTTGVCVDAEGAASRNGTDVIGWQCNGERNQGWWYDQDRQTIHLELTHDRCLDVTDGDYAAGTALQIWDCYEGANQGFVQEAGTLRPTADTSLCVTVDGAAEPVRLQPCDGSSNQQLA